MLLRRICSTIVAVTVGALAVAACGSSGPSLPRTYTNPSLGISMRYPADWHLSAQVYKRVSDISVDCPVGRWPAERATLFAILDSLRISKPES